MNRMIFVTVGVLAIAFSLFGFIYARQAAFAQQDSTQLEQVCKTNPTSPICQEVSKDKSDEVSGIDRTLRTITNYVAYLAGVIAVIIMVVSGVSLITSGGDSGKIANARNSIIYTAAGIIAIIFARTLVLFIIDAVG